LNVFAYVRYIVPLYDIPTGMSGNDALRENKLHFTWMLKSTENGIFR